jgi:hypothetical protein
MSRRATPIIRTPGNDLRDEIAEVQGDLRRIQSEARAANDWKRELAVLDRRVRLIEVRLKDLKDQVVNQLNVNFDLDNATAEKMSVAFLAKQRLLKQNGDEDGE